MKDGVKCYVALGSNLNDRLSNLETAAQRLRAVSKHHFRVSPIYVTTALTPSQAPESWKLSYFNAVIEMEWSDSATSLLELLKKIERDLGRSFAERWAPRLIDLDLVLFGNQIIQQENLQIPHASMWDRFFVLGPFKHLAPSMIVPGKSQTVLARARALLDQQPQWMGILNLTPDSFSDGGTFNHVPTLQNKIDDYSNGFIGMIDLGAESTRPGAAFVSPVEEWQRLEQALLFSQRQKAERIFYPRISIDTRHAQTAQWALHAGADWINDVSGANDAEMMSVIAQNSCDYVFMHSLSVPADPKRTLSDQCDPVLEIKDWALQKIGQLQDAGIHLDRLIFDPGLGFGKTPLQSLTIARRIHEFNDLPVRILVGHSRKSFLNLLNQKPAMDRDWESIGLSIQMGLKGVDILRVHEAQHHARVFSAFQEAK